MTPKVSIIIPVYRTEKYLEASVDSVINQTYRNIDIILVDDGSPDGSPLLCDSLAKRYSNIQVVHKLNGGLSSARNAGLRIAKGEYILFLDSDDRLLPETITIMVGKAMETGADCVLPNSYYKIYENGKEKQLALHFESSKFELDPKRFALNIIIEQGRARRATAVLFKSTIIYKHQLLFLDKIVSEDFFFNLDYMRFAKKLAMIEVPTLLCLKRSGSISSSYFEDFFLTILKMDDKVKEFVRLINSDSYGSDIRGKRESLLFRNVLIYVIQVMMDKTKPYRERKKMAICYLTHERVEAAIAGPISIPYFNGVFRRLYMRLSLFLWRHKCYAVLCRLSYWAGLQNRI